MSHQLSHSSPRAPGSRLGPSLRAICCFGLGAAISTWGVIRGFSTIEFGTGVLMTIVLAGFLWLAWRALERHLALAAGAVGSYAVRHTGLVWALGLWSVSTYTAARPQLASSAGLEERLWLLAVLGAAGLPVMLWGGILFRRALEWALGGSTPDM